MNMTRAQVREVYAVSKLKRFLKMVNFMMQVRKYGMASMTSMGVWQVWAHV